MSVNVDCRGYKCVKNQSHLPGEAPDALVPVDGGGGAAVGVAHQHHALPQPPRESTLICGDGGRHNNLVTTDYKMSVPGNTRHLEPVGLLQHLPRLAGDLTHVLP